MDGWRGSEHLTSPSMETQLQNREHPPFCGFAVRRCWFVRSFPLVLCLCSSVCITIKYTHEWAFARVPYLGDGDRSKSSSPPQFSKMASARSSWSLFASEWRQRDDDRNNAVAFLLHHIPIAIVIHPSSSVQSRSSFSLGARQACNI